MVDGYLIAVAIISGLVAFSIGANDAADSLGTSYGSGAAPIYILILLGSCCEFVGAYWCSGHVAGTLIDKVIDDWEDLDMKTVDRMMLSACSASFFFIIVATLFKMPISGTHTIVGALLGVGLAAVGVDGINWHEIGIVIAGWVVSPILSAVLCVLLFTAVCTFTVDKDRYTFGTRILVLTLLAGIAVFLIVLLLIKLITTKADYWPTSAVIALGVSPVLGIFVCRAIVAVLVKPKTVCQGIALVLKFWNGSDFNLHVEEKNTQEINASVLLRQSITDPQARLEFDEQSKSGVINGVYRYLMLVAAMMVCVSHGSNDVANGISPFIAILSQEGKSVKWAYVDGSLGIALGLLILGWTVMETVGKKVVRLDFAKGFSA